MDVLSKSQRSYCMSRIKSKWTKQEQVFHNLLKGNRIKHKMHPNIIGSPDIILPKKRLAVFLHGCFWHKCPRCYVEPKSRKNYWIPKIEKNVERDKKQKRILKENGWKVVVIWGHDISRSSPYQDAKEIIQKKILEVV